jgi:hypothetical protein
MNINITSTMTAENTKFSLPKQQWRDNPNKLSLLKPTVESLLNIYSESAFLRAASAEDTNSWKSSKSEEFEHTPDRTIAAQQ